ncbi:uncharacterized protein TM35_000044310 [Trypanosoma theileri]|uniref:Uncharacterized protein n=1 Tax=Trypanosoma theileri TaxID=67003 RepID=A0A1X0P5L0_9TRYP|nr:uncharacterized protein TM35_000044310 [Trypanosoma theileri]ORC92217.1 hypothetical protein TM35_000044310 [Trypanosoma theileri]
MSSDEMDAFRAELLRQKIIFEAELRRQRETFEEQLSRMAQELADREADCRNLQAVVTILGKKIDSLLERRVATPQRRPSPSRQPNSPPDDHAARETASARHIPPLRVPSPTTRRASPFRRNTNSSSARLAPTGSIFHGQSISSVGGSCHNSPARTASLNGQRPKLGHENIPDHCLVRRTSGARSQKLKTGDY